MAIHHRVRKLEQHAARVRPPTCGCKDGDKIKVIQSPVFNTISEIRAYEATRGESQKCPVCGRHTLMVVKSPPDASMPAMRRKAQLETGT